MQTGRRAVLTENPANKRFLSQDAENQAETEWLGNLLSRWITAESGFERLPIVEEYHFAFPRDEEGEELAAVLLAFRAAIGKNKKRRK